VSIIETAMNKAQRRRDGTPPRVREQAPRPDSNVPASVIAQARKLKPAKVDSATMERNRVLLQIADQSALRAYKILRTRLLQKMVTNGWHSLAVTGSATGEGKTLTAINLAIALAQDVNTWVFLVDLDLQRPRIAPNFGMSFDKGLGDYLTGQASMDEIIYDPGVERLGIIPNTRTFDNSSELLASPRMLDLTQALAQEIPRRIVIFDMPPLLAVDDVLVFAPRVDGLLLVVAEGVTARGSLQKSKELLGDTNIIGVVLNQSAEATDSPYY
jgi:capsular exopolysaccharide synthesis family protein